MWKQAQEGLRRQRKEVRRRHAALRKGKQSRAEQRAVEQKEAVPVGRVPRISRLMALAVRMEGMVREGRVKDYAELARLGGISAQRSRRSRQRIPAASFGSVVRPTFAPRKSWRRIWHMRRARWWPACLGL